MLRVGDAVQEAGRASRGGGAGRLVALCALHLATYLGHVGAIAEVWRVEGETSALLWALVACHALGGLACVLATWWEIRSGRVPCYLAPPALLVLGVAQSIQVWYACEDFATARRIRRQRRESAGSLASAPRPAASALLSSGTSSGSTPPRFVRGRGGRRTPCLVAAPRAATAIAWRRPRFHCRGVDAVVECSAFAGILGYALSAPQLGGAAARLDPLSERRPDALVLWGVAALSLLSATAAAMEVDCGVCEAVAACLDAQGLRFHVLHCLLRATEIASRLWALGALSWAVASLQGFPEPLRSVPVVVIFDYLVTLLVVSITGGCEPHAALVALAVVAADVTRLAGPSPTAPPRAARRAALGLSFLRGAELAAALVCGLAAVPGLWEWAHSGEEFRHLPSVQEALARALPRSLLVWLLVLGVACALLHHCVVAVAFRRALARCVRREGMHRFAERDDVEALRQLLREVSPNLPNGGPDGLGADGYTALQVAARAGAERAVVLLLRQRADPCVKSAGGGETALMLAARGGHDRIVRRLLSAPGGMRVLSEAMLASGDTAMHLAAAHGHTACVHTLLRARADPHQRNSLGLTPLAAQPGVALSGLASGTSTLPSLLHSAVAPQWPRAVPSGGGSCLLRSHSEPSVGPVCDEGGGCGPSVSAGSSGDGDTSSSGIARPRSSWPGPGPVPIATDRDLAELLGAGAAPRAPSAVETSSAAESPWPSGLRPGRGPVGRRAVRGACGRGMAGQGADIGAAASSVGRGGALWATGATVSAADAAAALGYRPPPSPLGVASLVALASPGALGRASAAAMAAATAALGEAPGAPEMALSRFRILGVLGEGTFGIVYHVADLRHTVSHRIAGGAAPEMALKILHRRRYRAPAMRERALQERRVLKEARHPFIVRLHAAFHTPADELALVMEYCPSGDLNDLLVRCGRPGLAEITVRKVLAEVLLALQYLHEDLDVVYRDLKPENIVFDAAMRAKLTDFGLARIGAARTGGASSFCGSKFYVAPEVPRGDEVPYGPAVDLYALGLVSWVCLTGGRRISDADSGAQSSRPGPAIGGPLAEDTAAWHHPKEVRAPPETHEALREDLRRRRARQDVGVRISEIALSWIEALTSKSPMRRGTARALRAHPLFTSPTADEPPLACDEDWAALLPPRYDGDDGAADAHDEEASAASSWDRESDETAWTWEAPEV